MHIQTYAQLGCFMVGMAAGTVLCAKVLSARYERIAQEEIDSVKDAYTGFDHEVEAPTIEDAEQPSEHSYSSIEQHPDAREAFTSYRGTVEKSYSGLPIREEETDEEPDEGKEEVVYEEELSDIDEDEDDKEIHVISEDDFYQSHSEYDKNSLTFYEGDVTLTDDQDQPIVDVDMVVGEGNLKFGVLSRDKNTVYIRNPRLGSDYEVVLDHRTFVEVVCGIAPDQIEV